jgi:hypothetical protein
MLSVQFQISQYQCVAEVLPSSKFEFTAAYRIPYRKFTLSGQFPAP